MVLKYDFDIDMSLSTDLCEFVGVILGDGNIFQYPRTIQIQVTGDVVLDAAYYRVHLSPLCQRLFNIVPSISLYPTKITLSMYAKQLGFLFKKRFHVLPGPKAFTARIPDAIFYSNSSLRCACLRGLFDTDGGVGFDKRKVYRKPYVRINYVSASFDLIQQISYVLDDLNIPHSIHIRNQGRAQQIQINGEKNVKSFIQKIGFSNPRHLNKVHYLL